MEIEILKKAKQGNEEATSQIMNMYKPLVMAIARKYFLINSSLDDLVQEGMIGLFNAFRSYNLDGVTSFKSYASLCINRQIQNAIKINNRNKNIPLNTYFSINNQGKILLQLKNSEDKEEDEENGFYIPSKSLTPEESIIFREKLNEVNKTISTVLSKYEKQVLFMYIAGLNYNEIALKLKKQPKSIDNALSRIKIKLKDVKCI